MTWTLYARFVCLIALLIINSQICFASEQYDLVIVNARFAGDQADADNAVSIGIRDGKISKIGTWELDSDQKTIDANGMIVGPGRVAQTEMNAYEIIKENQHTKHFLNQGVTLLIVGDSHPTPPLSQQDALRFGWASMNEYLSLLHSRGLPFHLVQTFDEDRIRKNFLVQADHEPTADETRLIQRLIDETLNAGGVPANNIGRSAEGAIVAQNNCALERRLKELQKIEVGHRADLILVTWDKSSDKNNSDESQTDDHSEQVQHVILSGQLVFSEGELTGDQPGEVFRDHVASTFVPPYEQATGPVHDEMKIYDEAIREYMKQHRIPGLAVAITHKGRLVHARGYGEADLETGELVQPTSLFRIASISKPITAVAILQLVEQGKIGLDDPVFEILDQYQPAIADAGENFESRLNQITIRHLLEHRAGWDRSVSFDAMFRSIEFAEQVGSAPPASAEDVIVAMLTQELDFEPGERYAYSNLGYNLLGRVIEKISGQGYEEYVQQHVLNPLGIQTMKLGRTRLPDRAENEVRYYQYGDGTSVFSDDLGQQVPFAYGAWHLEAMDSHGGWIASAVDLAHFASAFDDPENCPILSKSSIDLMFARPPGLAAHLEDGTPKEVYYGLGWQVRDLGNGKINTWHTGALSGTLTTLIRLNNGSNFVALLNTRQTPLKSSLIGDIDRLMVTIDQKLEKQPEYDLFPQFEQ